MAILRDLDSFIYWDETRQMYIPTFWRKEILPSWLSFYAADPNVVNGVFTVNAAGVATPPTTFSQPYASVEGLDDNLGTPFEARNIMFVDRTDTTALANFTVLLQELGERRQLMNAPCHIRTIAGTARTPAIFEEPLMIPSRHEIQAIFAKISGGAVSIRMSFGGAQYFPWSPEFIRYRQDGNTIKDLIRKWMQRRQTVSPYWLTTENPIVLGAGGAADFIMKPGNDAQFEVFKISTVQTGNFAWSLEDAKTFQTLMNGQVTATNATGDALFPTLLSTPYLLPSDKRFRLRVLDLSGAPNTIFFTLCGRKIYAPIMEMREALFDTAVPTPADSQALIVPKPME